MILTEFLLAILLIIRYPALGQRDVTQQPTQSSSQTMPAISENRTVFTPTDLAKLTAHSDLILVPVIVTDKSDKHVSGLQKDAFHIEENGNPRSVAVFEEAKTERLAARAAKDASDGYSNFVSNEDHRWRMTTIVLDMINTPWMRQLEAKKQLIDYLLRSASHDETMAIFGLNGSGLHQLHPFTRDTGVLIEALQKFKLSLSSEERTQAPGSFHRRSIRRTTSLGRGAAYQRFHAGYE